MNTNDQWFEPGDKVMRVSYANKLGLPLLPSPSLTEKTDFGNVLCVERCFPLGAWNRVLFVGVKPRGVLPERGFFACCFRKVEEIKLCVQAVQRKPEPVRVDENGKATWHWKEKL